MSRFSWVGPALGLLSCARSPQSSQQPGPTVVDVSSPKQQECVARATAPRSVPKDHPTSIEVSHILVRHAQLDRPEGATRSRGEACLRALAALEALQGGADWNATVDEYSDSGRQVHGSLGTISMGDASPAFENAAFSLDHDELSYVVETDRGFHVILRH